MKPSSRRQSEAGAECLGSRGAERLSGSMELSGQRAEGLRERVAVSESGAERRRAERLTAGNEQLSGRGAEGLKGRTERLSGRGAERLSGRGVERAGGGVVLLLLGSFFLAAQGYDASVGCPPGTFLNASGAVCVNCPPNFYKDNSSNATSCTPCPLNANSSEASVALSNCSCNPGYEQLTNSDPFSCSICSPGFASPGGNGENSTCQACARGKYAGASGASVCLDCASGSYANLTAQTSCDVCPQGTFTPSALEACQNCAQGTYNNQTSQSACVACPIGYDYSQEASTAETDCRQACGPGFAEDGARGCSLCSSGSYSMAAWHNVNCSLCGVNTSSQLGAIAANNCTCGPGYSGAGGLQDCTACPIGFYKNVSGPSACIPCPRGTFGGSVAQAECATCPDGSYNNVTQQSSCIVCGVGTFTASVFEACQDCAEGTYNNATSQSACASCPSVYDYSPARSTSELECRESCGPGFEADDARGCRACVVAKYSSMPWHNSNCSDCGLSTTSGLASVSPDNCTCDVGFTGPGGLINCSACLIGTYKNNSGSSECSPCPNFTTSTSAATFCSCLPLFLGPTMGPCCPKASTKFLTLGLDPPSSGELFSPLPVYLQIRNISSGSPVWCQPSSGMEMSCVNISVYYTIDGSDPKALSSQSCESSQAQCGPQQNHSITLQGSRTLKVFVKRTSEFTQAELNISDALVPALYTLDSCNTDVEAEGMFNLTPPVLNITLIPPDTRDGYGKYTVNLSLAASEPELRYETCLVDPPTVGGNVSACIPPVPTRTSSLYTGPLTISRRSYIRATPFDVIRDGNYSEAEVPVRHKVLSDPSDQSTIAPGSSIHLTCSDDRTSKFVYSIKVDARVNSESGWSTAELPASACDDGQMAATIPFPIGGNVEINVSAVDQYAQLVCDKTNMSFSIKAIGDPGAETCELSRQRLVGNIDAASAPDWSQLTAFVSGPDDVRFLNEELLKDDAKFLKGYENCLFQDDGTFLCS